MAAAMMFVAGALAGSIRASSTPRSVSHSYPSPGGPGAGWGGAGSFKLVAAAAPLSRCARARGCVGGTAPPAASHALPSPGIAAPVHARRHRSDGVNLKASCELRAQHPTGHRCGSLRLSVVWGRPRPGAGSSRARRSSHFAYLLHCYNSKPLAVVRAGSRAAARQRAWGLSLPPSARGTRGWQPGGHLRSPTRHWHPLRLLQPRRLGHLPALQPNIEQGCDDVAAAGGGVAHACSTGAAGAALPAGPGPKHILREMALKAPAPWLPPHSTPCSQGPLRAPGGITTSKSASSSAASQGSTSSGGSWG
jgi:hypothetical protein